MGLRRSPAAVGEEDNLDRVDQQVLKAARVHHILVVLVDPGYTVVVHQDPSATSPYSSNVDMQYARARTRVLVTKQV